MNREGRCTLGDDQRGEVQAEEAEDEERRQRRPPPRPQHDLWLQLWRSGAPSLPPLLAVEASPSPSPALPPSHPGFRSVHCLVDELR